MLKQFGGFLLALTCAAAAGCSRDREQAPAVATPSVTLGRAQAAVGSPLDVTYRFLVAREAPPFTEDYLVFVHFMDSAGEQMWTDDHQPPTPTRQWKPGQMIEYTRTIFIPKFPYSGETRVQLGLYSPRSGDRLVLAGEDTGMRAYQVATFSMVPAPEDLFVAFKDGWHETEVSDDGGLEWQWSKREGILSFRNPRRDAELFLQVDQAVSGLPKPQRVEVRHAASVLDSFLLPAGTRELRRIPLPANVLGDGDTVELTVAVDETFVPAEMPALRSSDSRELGIRVFRAYVAPKN
jgi:hypothetical protein